MKQVVVVTGASQGVGRAIARAFGERKARVGLIARGEDGLRAAQKEIEEAGGEAMVLPLDVADPAAVIAAADQVVERWGQIDVWVNDAMLTVFSPFREMSPEEFKRGTEATYLGTVNGTRAALKHMLPRDAGKIIQIGSALAYRSIPLQSVYCGAKAAIRGFTDSLRCELLHDRSHVKISMLQLPAVNTPQFDVVLTRLPNNPQPVPPIYQPEVIARAVLSVAKRMPREVYVGFGAWKAIVGQKLMPWLLDRYLSKAGYSGQQTNEPASPERKNRNNLTNPLPGDRGAHGHFDSRARSRSPEVWVRTHPRLVASMAGLAAAGLFVAGRTVLA